MTVIADNKKRVTLPTKPGACFDLQPVGKDKFILTRLVPAQTRPAKIKLKKIGDYTVGELGHPVDAAALQRALEEFP